jgi:hypothetical protein
MVVSVSDPILAISDEMKKVANDKTKFKKDAVRHRTAVMKRFGSMHVLLGF